jgi:glycerol-3-phosphate dehydrogenase
LSKAFNLLITRELLPEYAVGFYSRRFSKDSDAMLDKGSRLLFVVPWHQRSLIGTAHLPYHADPDTFEVTEAEIRDFMDEINQAYPAASLQLRDISCAYGGLLPAADNSESVVRLVRRHRLYDHRKEDGVEGLISVSGVKFTEARYVAEKTVDLVFTKLSNRAPKSSSAATPLYDARFANLQTFLADEIRNRSPQLSKDSLKLLIDNYGSSYPEVLEHARAHVAPSVASALPPILRAEILHAIRDEMAQKLADVVLRRTTLALPGKLTVESLKACAAAMAAELGWDAARVKREVEELRKAPYAPALGAVAA